jgi:oligopeptide transport system substrate-binding protein
MGWAVKAQGREPLTLNINIGADPPTLDPALATDVTSVTVIEQLFIGLVDLDDETAEVRPELATSWTVSPDGTVYTFTLRSDVYWTDGHPVTAGDVRYGILRTLNPATQSDYAYALYIIKNAAAYNTGAITDPNQVGVTALDDTHLRITLEYPASYALSILSMWIARPMPKWAIETWGDAWTEPGHIVTNGPYRLTEWVHNDHILLDKNPTYYDAANVQIERVKMWMVDDNTAWTMYLNGQLDTAGIPSGHMGDVPSQEVHIQPIACTYYYGFSVSQEPFNNPLVRKAFAAATDRQGLVNTLFGGIQRPALTFTPPGASGTWTATPKEWANNFLYEAIESLRGAYGNWRNTGYDNFVSQAAREQNPDTRKALYKQAEEILVETDAVMIPLYHYASVVAVKPYLERTFAAGGFDIATWRIRVSGTASPEAGGVLTSYQGDTVIQIPAGAVTDTIIITHTLTHILPPGGNLTGIGHEFDITAVYSSTGQPAQLAPGQTYTITVHYTDAEKGPAMENTLALYYWDGSGWVKEPSSVVDVAANTVTAHPNHFSLWAVLGETRRVYLPLVLRNYR